MIAVTFDYGQTLAELDVDLLCRRVAERSALLDAARTRGAQASAWAAYAAAKRAGNAGKSAWTEFMRTLLRLGEVRRGQEQSAALAEELADWLWDEQPRYNLWRAPIVGMFELVGELRTRGVPVGIVSNSEGRLLQLLDEIGQRELFECVADSGVLGYEKPDARIFEWAATELGVEPSQLIHVGDVWDADVLGALAAGARAVWFNTEPAPQSPSERVATCHDAASLRRLLLEWRVITES